MILVQTCKERWKNIRTVFLRHLRQKVPSGSSGGHKKKYYLEDNMQFIIPFVKSGKKQQGNISISSELEKDTNMEDIEDESNDEIIESVQVPESSELLSSHQDIAEDHDKIAHSAKKLKVNSKISDVDNCFMEYFETKKKKNSTTPECADQKFLLSLLPDIQQMSPIQKRQFKRKVLDVIGCILEDQGSLNPPSHSSSSSYSTLSTVPEARTDNTGNQYQQYDPEQTGFEFFNI